MSNGFLSRKGMIAILASVMFTVTACSDRKKVKDLEGDNGRLKQQITQLENEKKSAELKINEADKKIAELEAMSNSLAAEINDMKKADKTLANIVSQIEEKRKISADLDAVLEQVRAELAQAEADYELAKANEATAKANADQHTNDANMKMNMAVTMLTNANNRLKKAEAQEARIVELQAALDERQAKIDEAARQWRKLYAEHKLDAMFERLTDENKMNEAVTFQYSIVGLNLSIMDIHNIRQRVAKVQSADTNIYKQDVLIWPNAELVQKKVDAINAKANVEANENSTKWDSIVARFGTIGVTDRTMNDSYLAMTTGAEIIALRDDLMKINKDDRAVFIIPRLVEKLSVSMNLRVKMNVSDNIIKDEIKQTLYMKLTEPKEVAVDISKPIDVTVPMNAMFDANQCATFNSQCLGALGKAGFLDKNVKLGDAEVSLRSFLMEQFKISADQSMTDMLAVENGYYKDGFISSMARSLSGKKCFKVINRVRTEVECEGKKDTYIRVPTLEEITLEFTVNQIQELPRTGYLPVDFAMQNDFEDFALNLSDGRLHIPLPISSNRTVVMNIEKEASDDVAGTFGMLPANATDEQIEKHISRVLGIKNSVHMKYSRALKQ